MVAILHRAVLASINIAMRIQTEKEALIEASNIHSFVQPMAITLTMKMRANGKANDLITASTNLRHFLKRLNGKILGQAAKRYGRKLRIFPVIEQNAEGRLHFHAVIDRPVHVPVDRFSATVREQWSKTGFGYRHVDIQEMTSDGWISYILKRRQKKNGCLDAIDWANCTTIPG